MGRFHVLALLLGGCRCDLRLVCLVVVIVALLLGHKIVYIKYMDDTREMGAVTNGTTNSVR